MFVRRQRPFNFHFIWVYNEAEIDGSKVVWVHDRGDGENRRLMGYYGGRRAFWRLAEGNDQPRLERLGTEGPRPV